MISSLGAMLRISLRRSRADWPIVVAAGLICLLAATLLAAGSIYANAVSTAGLHRVLADAPADQGNVTVTYRVAPAEVATTDALVSDAIDGALRPIGGLVSRIARSDSYALPGQRPDQVRDLAVLGYAEGLETHGTISAGTWPADAAPSSTTLPVALAEGVAGRLGIDLGDRLTLESRVEPGFLAEIEVVGIFRINDPTARYWWDEPQALDGVIESEQFTTHGPFYTTQEALLERGTPARIVYRWRATPNATELTVDQVGGLASGVASLRAGLAAALGSGVEVTTSLPDILDRADRSLLVSRTGVILLTVQLVVLASYAVLLSAALLIEHRRVDTAMLRSRGAGARDIVALAFIEGLLLTVPAAVAGPWLAAFVLGAFNLAGPLADIGLAIEPTVTADAYVASGAAALVCLAALTLPALRSARTYANVHAKLARGETRAIGQRLGLDIALLAVTGVGLWQLRHYGAPLTRSVQGTLGLDPLLVATPAIGLLAGGIVALRIVPLLAQAIERLTVRTQGLVPSLGARQLARRPLRYTRSAMLLMLAMALGVFAVSYTWTWSASQRDQATHEVGADIRVRPGTQHDAAPRWAIDQALAAQPGVIERLPVDREAIQLAATQGGGDILALDTSVAASVLEVRPDMTSQPIDVLMAPLAAARPTVEAVRLPGEPRQLRMDVTVDIRSLERLEFDVDLATEVNKPAELSEIAGWRGLTPSVVVRDARGTLHRFGATETTVLTGGPKAFLVPLGGGEAAGAFADPLDLLAVELFIALPEGFQSPDATVTVADVEAAGADGVWRGVPLDLGSGWRSTAAVYGQAHHDVAEPLHNPALEATVGEPGLRLLPGMDQFRRGLVLSFAPASLSRVADDPVPVVANDAFLAATAGAVGDELPILIDGVRREVIITASVAAFPATSPTDPTAAMDLATSALLRFEGNDAVEPPDEWWLRVEDGSEARVLEALAQAPIRSRLVVGQEDRSRALSTDPVALGIIGSLVIGFVAAALFAVVGFVVSAAVSARERISEFALLRALGLSANQLSVWLSLENAVLAAVSLVTGTALGLVIAWVVLPFITVTQGASTPFPPVTVDIPWETIAVLEVIGIVALTLTVAFLAWLLRRIGLASVLRMSED